MTFLADAAEWLGDQLQTVAGASVLYVRRSQILPLTGWLTMQDCTLDFESELPELVNSFDWSFLRSELAFDDTIIVPRPGDRIIVGDVTYEAMPLGSQPCWAILDPSFSLLTVHTKRIE